MTLNRHFALNSVLCRYVWSSEAWLSKLGYTYTSWSNKKHDMQNNDRFSKFFRCYAQQEICNKAIIADPADTKHYIQQESRALARKPRDAAAVLFGQSSPTTLTTSTYIRVAKLRKPCFRAPNIAAQSRI